MLIKPIIKTNLNNYSICSWILDKFPEDYEQMRYVEPFLGNGSVLLNKKKSIEEVTSDLNKNIISIWRIIRDENKSLKSKLSKFKYNEKFFESLKNKKTNEDYFKEGIKEFVLRRMTRLGNKETFDVLDRKKSNVIWKETEEELKVIENRIKDVYFLERSHLEVIKNFDNQNVLCFCCPPQITENKKAEMTTDDYVGMTDALLSFRGKVVFCASYCSFYKRIFADWKIIKKKSSGKKQDCLWINF